MAKSKRNLVPRSMSSVTDRNLNVKENNFSFIPRNDHTFNSNLKNLRLVTPKCYKKGKTVIRIWPMLDPEAPSSRLLNGRLNNVDTAGLSGMSISEPVCGVNYAGITEKARPGLDKSAYNPVTYVICRDKENMVDGISFWDEPYVKLYTVAKNAHKNGKFSHNNVGWKGEWNPLMISTANQSACIPAFKYSYYIIGSVVENGEDFNLENEIIKYKKDGKETTKIIPRNGIALGDLPSDPLVVIKVSHSTGKKIFEMCNREKPEFNGDPETDPSVQFLYGDPTGKFDAEKGIVRGGLFFTLYNPTILNITENTSFSGQKPGEIVEYEVAVDKKHQFNAFEVKSSLGKEQVSNILDKHIYFWKESEQDPDDSYLFNELPLEQRAELLAKAFKPVKELLKLCWLGTPYLQMDAVKSVFNETKHVDMGANSKAAKATDIADSVEDDDFDDEEEVVTPPKAKKSETPKAKTKPSAADLIEDEDLAEDELDEDELDDELDEDETEEDDEESDESDDEEDEEEDDEDEDDEDEDEDEDEESDEDDSGFDDDEPDVDVTAQLAQSLNTAKALARSKARSTPTAAPVSKPTPPKTTKPMPKVNKKK